MKLTKMKVRLNTKTCRGGIRFYPDKFANKLIKLGLAKELTEEAIKPKAKKKAKK